MNSILRVSALLVGMIFGQWFLLPTVAYSLRPAHAPRKQSPIYRLGKARSLSFTAVVWVRMQRGTSEPKLTEQMKMNVRAVRPGSIRIEAVPSEHVSPGEYEIANIYDLFVSDGKSQYSFSSKSKECIQEKANPTLDMSGSTQGGLGLSRAEVLFARDPLREFEFKFQGKTTLNGEKVAVYSQEWNLPTGPQRIRLYIATKTGLPVRLSEFSKEADGRWIEFERTEYSNWTLDAKIPGTIFNATPPAGAKMLPNSQTGLMRRISTG